MILIDLRDYVEQHKRVSLAQMATHFDMPETALQGMLERWVNKGLIQKMDANACGGCASRCSDVPIMYEWQV